MIDEWVSNSSIENLEYEYLYVDKILITLDI